MKSAFRLLRILSMDVVVGSMTSGMLVLYVLQQQMPPIWWAILPLSVWVIYTADHLLDAYRLTGEAHTDRHLFHQQHFRPIVIIWGLTLLVTALVLPLFLPTELIYFGYAMGGLVLLHLLLVWLVGNKTSRWLQKELGVGLIYCLGIWGGPFAYHHTWPTMAEYLLFLQFFILAMMNLLVFSMYEKKTDEIDGHSSFVRAIGTQKTLTLTRILSLIFLGMGVGVLWTFPQTNYFLVEFLYLLMGGLLFLIVEMPTVFSQGERYRIWGDGVFIFPIILLLWT